MAPGAGPQFPYHPSMRQCSLNHRERMGLGVKRAGDEGGDICMPSHCFSLVHQSGSDISCGRYVKTPCAGFYVSKAVSESPKRKDPWEYASGIGQCNYYCNVEDAVTTFFTKHQQITKLRVKKKEKKKNKRQKIMITNISKQLKCYKMDLHCGLLKLCTLAAIDSQ